ncbi:MAG: GGDEF domain-containing protein [Rhodoferax sp.]|nr:GGDEF domain-containing protein [Rhodoferax sp.]
MTPTAWAYLDPRGMGITLSLSAALLALVLLLTNRALGRGLPGMQQAACGVLLASVGFALNMLQAWLTPLVALVLAVVLMVAGVALVLGGVRLLRDMPARWGWLLACCLAGLAIALWFGLVTPNPRWRIGLLSLLLAYLSGLLARTALGESRAQYQAGMRLLALLGVVFAVLMGLRSLAAALGLVESSVSSTLVNSVSVLAAGMSLIGGVVGLVLVISGDLMALVEHQRTHDPLTDLLNRLGLRQWVDQQASHLPLALGMVDLDHFKQVNDTHGHALGDLVIRHLAVLLRGCESPTCRAARLGGEEFVIVALGADQGDALHHKLEQLRTQFQQGGPLPGTSLSAGMARGHVSGFEGTLREADSALYRAKQAGRDRVESAPLSTP